MLFFEIFRFSSCSQTTSNSEISCSLALFLNLEVTSFVYYIWLLNLHFKTVILQFKFGVQMIGVVMTDQQPMYNKLTFYINVTLTKPELKRQNKVF